MRETEREREREREGEREIEIEIEIERERGGDIAVLNGAILHNSKLHKPAGKPPVAPVSQKSITPKPKPLTQTLDQKS